jgi:hypothetical protein
MLQANSGNFKVTRRIRLPDPMVELIDEHGQASLLIIEGESTQLLFDRSVVVEPTGTVLVIGVDIGGRRVERQARLPPGFVEPQGVNRAVQISLSPADIVKLVDYTQVGDWFEVSWNPGSLGVPEVTIDKTARPVSASGFHGYSVPEDGSKEAVR